MDWFDADPTNDRAPPRRVTVAGRDCGDVSVLRGMALDRPALAVSMSVDVARA